MERNKSILQNLSKSQGRMTKKVDLVQKIPEYHGGVVKVSLDWQIDDLGVKTLSFTKYQSRIQGRRTVGIFIAGGTSVDKAVREANVKCITTEGIPISK